MGQEYKAIIIFNFCNNSVSKYMSINRGMGVEHVHTHTIKFCSSREKHEIIYLWGSRTGNYLINQYSTQKDNDYIHDSSMEILDFNFYICMCKSRYGLQKRRLGRVDVKGEYGQWNACDLKVEWGILELGRRPTRGSRGLQGVRRIRDERLHSLCQFKKDSEWSGRGVNEPGALHKQLVTLTFALQ